MREREESRGNLWVFGLSKYLDGGCHSLRPGRTRWGYRLHQELSFERIKFEICSNYQTGDLKWMVGYRSVNLSEVVRARDESLEIKIHQHKDSI